MLFPQCFLPIPKKKFPFNIKFILLSANAFNLDQSQNLLFGKDLSPLFTELGSWYLLKIPQ